MDLLHPLDAPGARLPREDPREDPDGAEGVALVGFAPGALPRLAEIAPYLPLSRALTAGASPGVILQGAGVVVLGPEVKAGKARQLLEALDGEAASRAVPPLYLVLAAGDEIEVFADWVARDQLFFLTRQAPTTEELAELLTSALERQRSRVATWRAEKASSPEAGDRTGSVGGDPGSRRRALERRAAVALARELAAIEEPEHAAQVVSETLSDLLAAQRVELFLYDREDEALWAPLRGEWDERESSVSGLVGFVARTARPVRVEDLAADPRHDPSLDLPSSVRPSPGVGMPYLAVPIRAHAEGGSRAGGTVPPRAIGVLTALREGAREAFTAADQGALEAVAERIAPAVQVLAADLADRSHQQGIGAAEDLFRREAVEHHISGLAEQGDLLRLSPAWAGWTYRLLLVILASALLFSLLAPVNHYASGPAVVRAGGRLEITAPQTGTVTRLEVEHGQRVTAGQPLVTFYDVREAAELERIDQEVELQLVQRLRDPADPSTERALVALRAERELAASRLEERSVRAPAAGVASEVRVRPGQHVLPGQILLSLRQQDSELAIVALLPGTERPRLAAGQPLRLELAGYRYAYQRLVVGEVGDDVLGPAEARRALGAEVAETLPLTGPVVFVRARLPEATFHSEGRSFEYHEGMHGTAEVRVRSERLLFTLIPGLRAVTERAR